MPILNSEYEDHSLPEEINNGDLNHLRLGRRDETRWDGNEGILKSLVVVHNNSSTRYIGSESVVCHHSLRVYSRPRINAHLWGGDLYSHPQQLNQESKFITHFAASILHVSLFSCFHSPSILCRAPLYTHLNFPKATCQDLFQNLCEWVFNLGSFSNQMRSFLNQRTLITKMHNKQG